MHTVFALGLVVAGEVIVGLNFNVLNIAMPTIAKYFELSSTQIQWAMNTYGLTEASLLMVGARLVDRFGQRFGYLYGCLLTIIGLVGCSIAPSISVFFVGRIINGIGTSLLLPATLSLLATTFPEVEGRVRALAIVVLGATIAVPFGVVIGGWLIDIGSWRTASAVALLAATCTLIAAISMPPRRVTIATQDSFIDFVSVILISLGLGAVVWALSIFGSKHLQALPEALAPLGVGLILLLFFWVRDRSSPAPLFPRAIMSGFNFLPALSIQALCVSGLTSGLVLVSMSLQHGLDFSALENGYAMIPYAVVSIFAMMAVRRMSGMITKHLHISITIGFLVMATGHILLSFAANDASFAGGILPGLCLLAIGVMIGLTGSTSEVYRDVPAEHRGIAGAMVYVFRMIFQSMGFALVLSAAEGDLAAKHVPLQAFATSYRLAAGICVLGIVVTFATLRRPEAIRASRVAKG